MLLEFLTAGRLGGMSFISVSFTVLFLLVLLYRALLPKPLPGIPYNKAAANSILGDIPTLKAYIAHTGEFFAWTALQCRKNNSPIVQAFARPFGKPWVIVSDAREAYDILKRRCGGAGRPAEFDRSAIISNWFWAVAKDHHITMLSATPEFKRNRHLVNPLMGPTFMKNLFAPKIYETMLNFVDLWREKAKVANGLPFAALVDTANFALDATWASLVPEEDQEEPALVADRKFLKDPVQGSGRQQDRFMFKHVAHPPIRGAFLALADNMELVLKSTIPNVYGWWLRQLPSVRKEYKVRYDYFRQEIDKAIARMDAGQTVKCSLDEVLRREAAQAQKEGREPDYHAEHIESELFGFVTASFHTTASAISWSLKLLADTPSVQKRLRSALCETYTDAEAESRQPTVSEITGLPCAYLDAVIEELLRCGLTEPGSVRTALTDVVILGHHIPKGTDVFLNGNGPGFFSPGFQIDEALRSPSSRANKDALGEWDPADMHLFDPSRWLNRGPGGTAEEFNPRAGPMLSFGLGPRGCHGRRLAYLDMRIFVVMLLWNFELLTCPGSETGEGMSSYKATDGVAHTADVCFVRLKTVREGEEKGTS